MEQQPTPPQYPNIPDPITPQPSVSPVQSPIQPIPPIQSIAPVQPIPPSITNQTLPSQKNPGKTLGIIGLIFAFIGLSPIGLILSIISTVRSNKARASKSLGVIGIVFNVLATILVILLVSSIFLLTYSGINARAKDSAAQTAALSVKQKAESFQANNQGAYPQSISDFNQTADSSLSSIKDVTVTDQQPVDTTSVMYKACSKTGAIIEYYQSSSSSADSNTSPSTAGVNIITLGDVNGTICSTNFSW